MDIPNASPGGLDAQVLTHYDSTGPYMFEFRYYYHQTLMEELLQRKVTLLKLLRAMNLE